MTNTQESAFPVFTEHRVARDRGSLYVRDFSGTGPAFVLLHGFPDNAHIYDDLIPHLVAAGRRTVAIDFLGFGASDKPAGVQYSFEQQLGDLEAMVEALGLDKIIPVGHDAGGPAAVNFALKHPDKTSAITLMNAFYGDAPGLRVPELIELFSNKKLAALNLHFLQSPQQFVWLLDFQRELLLKGLTKAQAIHNKEFLGPIIDNNFTQQPSAASAFANDVPTDEPDCCRYGPTRRVPAIPSSFAAHLGEGRSLPPSHRGRTYPVTGWKGYPSRP